MPRRLLLIPLDLMIAASSIYLANALRFDSLIPQSWPTYPGAAEALNVLALVVATRGVCFVLMGLYRSLWAYASIPDLLLILKTTAVSSLCILAILLFYNRLEGIPRTVLILDSVLVFLLLGFRSFSWRLFRDIYFVRRARGGRRTLLIGAGVTANRLVTDLRTNESLQIMPIGYLDDDPAKGGAHLQGLPVLGKIEDLDHVLTEKRIAEVIISAKLPGSVIRHIYRTCETRHIPCKTLPPLSELLARPDIGKSIRNVSLEDLLGRDVVRLETEGIRKAIENKVVLITGAGGSIGSEVCRQILTYSPGVIVLFENAETPLYEIDYELRKLCLENNLRTHIDAVIGDVRNVEDLAQVFRQNEINTVFHCAAYKHVPMMELHPEEAVKNNVLGTINVANAARDAGVERFVMISTDKAVNPVNVMGATKRIAEIYIQNLARVTDTRYITVRFGNVLGSNGSVIPLFQKQIEAGGPVTVTHPDIIRYFMTIKEAAGLVIQAGVMGQGGEIFLLDMGEPVKIKDLAEDLIRFAGLVPHQDIQIHYIGLRPGEKLYEELLLAEEGIEPTRHEKIHIANSRISHLPTLLEKVHELEEAARRGSRPDMDAIMSSIVPEYRPVSPMIRPADRAQEKENARSRKI
ncbi:MAG: polysaccharide biosynthesis protein [Leptospirales bacterium]|nr:polysaccharide biosynthesis protein [Leptospirales bacterium]